MASSKQLPWELRLVALLFLLNGISAVITIVVAILHSGFQLDFGVLGIFVYFGLLRLSSGWRTCALVMTWIGLCLIPIVSLLALSSGAARANINVFGISAPAIPPLVAFFFSLLWFGLALWQLKVLYRPDVVELFLVKQLSQEMEE